MKNLHNTDKKGLQNMAQYEPKPELWENIENALNQEKKPRFGYMHWTIGIAATLALLFTINFLFSGKLETANQNVLIDVKEPRKGKEQNAEIYDEDVVKQKKEEHKNVLIPDKSEAQKVVTTTVPFLTFTDSTSIGNGALSYTWNFADDNIVNAAPIMHSYTASAPLTFSLHSNIMSGNFTILQNNSTPSQSGSIPDLHLDPSILDNYFDVPTTDLIVTTYRRKDANKPIEQDNLGKSGFIGNKISADTIGEGYWKRLQEIVNSESYAALIENVYKRPEIDPLSTFGIDVDNASYTVMRTKINGGEIVPKDAVRVEEFVNYFDYTYPQPTNEDPFSVNMEMAECAWSKEHKLVRIGLKGKDIDYKNLSASNLVFLIDVSGSMSDENKLPLVKQSLKLLVDQMSKNDRIAIVTYAGAAGLALPSTTCDEKDVIKKKIDKLESGGSTAGGEGIKLAYKVALDNLLEKGNNRVILCTDGDFNVGASSDNDMKDLIIEYRNKGIFITVGGFGMGNYQDSKMETIADNGNGNYFYIDNYNEAEKVFQRDLRATLFTIAKDVKIQVEFNPKHVKAYRLIGYENRLMPPQDFNDDTKDGGELGAGHKVTALYEIIPANSDEPIPGYMELKYQKPDQKANVDYGDELLTIKLRYKKPHEDVSKLMSTTLSVSNTKFNDASEDFRFAAGVSLYAQQLRQSAFVPKQDFTQARKIIAASMSKDPNSEKSELLNLIDKAGGIYQVSAGKD